LSSHSSGGRSVWHASLLEDGEGALGVGGGDDQIEVVLGDRAAARPGGQAAAEHEADLAVAQRRGRALEGRADGLEGRFGHGCRLPGYHDRGCTG
jgi:hypothetical protein